jgi:hypothetical protein
LEGEVWPKAGNKKVTSRILMKNVLKKKSSATTYALKIPNKRLKKAKQAVERSNERANSQAGEDDECQQRGYECTFNSLDMP